MTRLHHRRAGWCATEPAGKRGRASGPCRLQTRVCRHVRYASSLSQAFRSGRFHRRFPILHPHLCRSAPPVACRVLCCPPSLLFSCRPARRGSLASTESELGRGRTCPISCSGLPVSCTGVRSACRLARGLAIRQLRSQLHIRSPWSVSVRDVHPPPHTHMRMISPHHLSGGVPAPPCGFCQAGAVVLCPQHAAAPIQTADLSFTSLGMGLSRWPRLRPAAEFGRFRRSWRVVGAIDDTWVGRGTAEGPRVALQTHEQCRSPAAAPPGRRLGVGISNGGFGHPPNSRAPSHPRGPGRADGGLRGWSVCSWAGPHGHIELTIAMLSTGGSWAQRVACGAVG